MAAKALNLFYLYGLSLAAGAALVISLSAHAETLPGWDLCPFKNWTGCPCPGCGLTHSFCSISHGQFSQAVVYNPFGYIFYALAVALALWPLLSWIFPRLRNVPSQSRMETALPPLLVLSMMLFGVVRVLGLWGG